MAKKRTELVSYAPGEADGWHTCIRVNEQGASIGRVRAYDPERPSDSHHELLEIEHLGPGLAAVVESHGRPAMVNSRSYEEGWERIFGGRADPGEA